MNRHFVISCQVYRQRQIITTKHAGFAVGEIHTPTMSPGSRFGINIVEPPFALGVADIQPYIVWFACPNLKQDILSSVWRLAMVKYPLMSCATLVYAERHKSTRCDKPYHPYNNAQFPFSPHSRQKKPYWKQENQKQNRPQYKNTH